MSAETVIHVGTSLYIGIDLLYPKIQDVKSEDIIDNLTRIRDAMESKLSIYDEIYRVSMILSYLNINKVESYINTVYFSEGISNSQYDKLIDTVINTAENLVHEASKNVTIFNNVCYLLVEIKVPNNVDINLAVFEPIQGGPEYLNIAVGPDLISYIDIRMSKVDNGFDYMNVSYIKLHTDNILIDKIEYKVGLKNYVGMVIEGYFKFLLNHNGEKPDLMIISGSYP
jgi:hypothetical protein